MADITIAPQDFKVNEAAAQLTQGTAGSAINAGEWVYKDSNRVYYLARANAAATSEVAGIAANSAISGGTLYVNETAPIVGGAVFTKDVVYVLSAATAGKAAPYSDLASTNIIVLLGAANSTSELILGIKNTGIVKT